VIGVVNLLEEEDRRRVWMWDGLAIEIGRSAGRLTFEIAGRLLLDRVFVFPIRTLDYFMTSIG
jgi:hypothetical protein